MKIPKEQIDNFLSIECVIVVAKYIDVLDEKPIFLDQIDALNNKIIEKSPVIAEKLKKFQETYEKWFQRVVASKTSGISTTEIEIILEKDRAREELIEVCVEYRKENRLSNI
jgi:hypothetical protein